MQKKILMRLRNLVLRSIYFQFFVPKFQVKFRSRHKHPLNRSRLFVVLALSIMKKLCLPLLGLFIIQSLFVFLHIGSNIYPIDYPVWPAVMVNVLLLLANFVPQLNRLKSYQLPLGMALGAYVLLLTLFTQFTIASQLSFAVIDLVFLAVLGLGFTYIRNSIIEYELAFATLGTSFLEHLDDPKTQKTIQSEIMRSRYSAHPLSIIKIKAGPADNDFQVNQALLQEIFQNNQDRFKLSRIANQIKQEVRLIDHVLFDEINKEILVLCPEFTRDEARQFSLLIKSKLEQSTKIKIESAQAAFPEDGLTFDGLLESLRTKKQPNYLPPRELKNTEDYDFITQST